MAMEPLPKLSLVPFPSFQQPEASLAFQDYVRDLCISLGLLRVSGLLRSGLLRTGQIRGAFLRQYNYYFGALN